MSNSKLYGGRWRTVGNLGGGGQGDVFRVVDEGGTHQGEFALKRLRDLSRIDRFRNEIEALKKLAHPNIVRLVDHSELATEDGDGRQFLVMPIAAEKDAEKRLVLFKGSIENTTRVAAQVAKALKASHDLDVIHRDVKPGNILFPTQSLDIWLSDFGICHIPKDDPDTPLGDVMGPRKFSAPEIEAGRGKDVLPAVDIYSLGQVVFYLLSGGRTFYRENVYDSRYDDYFRQGERSVLLRTLLARMVATEENRIKKMDDVIPSLERILDWERQAQAGGVHEALREKILSVRKTVHETDVASQQRAAVLANLAAQKKIVLDGIEAALRSDLEQIAAFASDGGELSARYTFSGPINKTIQLGGMRLNPVRGAEITVTKGHNNHKIYSLQFVLAEKLTFTIRHVRPGERLEPPVQTEQPLAILPILVTKHGGSLRRTTQIFSNTNLLALSEDNNFLSIGRTVPMERQSGRRPSGEQIFVNLMEFDASDWPVNQTEISDFVTANMAHFFDHIERDQ